MEFQVVNPNEYPDRDALLLRSGDATFFHTAAWARVLEITYGFEPHYFMLMEAERLSFLMPMMEINSPLKGKKGVSLPFTDSCAPHALRQELLKAAVRCAVDYGEKNGWKSIEWRDNEYCAEGAYPWETYHVHDIDLQNTETGLFANLSATNRRNIKKAVREGVTVRMGRSMDLMKSFYRLNCLTRKRHGLPPQPFVFFKRVFEHIISKDLGLVFCADHAGKKIAASVFFHFGTKALFKYGASEMRHQDLRPNNLLMWEALKWYHHGGYETMSLGRTELNNPGLLHYKRTWGAKESVLNYFRYDVMKRAYLGKRPDRSEFYRNFFKRTSPSVLRVIGRLFYKHVG